MRHPARWARYTLTQATPKPRLLIFDDATRAPDNRTQAIMNESLERLNVTRIGW